MITVRADAMLFLAQFHTPAEFRKKIGKMNTVLILNNQQYEITQSKNQGVLQKEFAQPPWVLV